MLKKKAVLPQKQNNSVSSDELSKRLAEKLLKGWKMLEAICESCMVPLMSKGTELVCVGCGPVVKKNSDEKKAQTKEESKEKKAETLPLKMEESPNFKKKQP